MRTRRSAGGFTLVEVCISVGLLAMLSAGLYGVSIMAMKLVHYNMVMSEARALGVQKIEEIVAGGLDDVAMQAPYDAQVDYILASPSRPQQFPVHRSVTVIGHNQDGSVVSNLADSAYIEVNVDVTCKNPLNNRPKSSRFTAIVQ